METTLPLQWRTAFYFANTGIGYFFLRQCWHARAGSSCEASVFVRLARHIVLVVFIVVILVLVLVPDVSITCRSRVDHVSINVSISVSIMVFIAYYVAVVVFLKKT